MADCLFTVINTFSDSYQIIENLQIALQRIRTNSHLKSHFGEKFKYFLKNESGRTTGFLRLLDRPKIIRSNQFNQTQNR